MDDPQKVLTVIQRTGFVTGTGSGKLGLILFDSYGMPESVSAPIIRKCLEDDLIYSNGHAYFLTQSGEDYLRVRQTENSKYDNPTTTPTNTQLRRIAKSKVGRWLVGVFWTIVLGAIGSLIASLIWEKCNADSETSKTTITDSATMMQRK